MSNTTIRRPRPAKPIRTQAVECTKKANSHEVIELFNAFIAEARKEFKKNDNVTVKGRKQNSTYDQVTFVSDNFNLTIELKGGMSV